PGRCAPRPAPARRSARASAPGPGAAASRRPGSRRRGRGPGRDAVAYSSLLSSLAPESAQDLLGDAQGGERALRAAVVEQRRAAVARRLGEPDVARDLRLEDARAEMLAHLVGDLAAQVVARVHHRENDAF